MVCGDGDGDSGRSSVFVSRQSIFKNGYILVSDLLKPKDGYGKIENFAQALRFCFSKQIARRPVESTKWYALYKMATPAASWLISMVLLSGDKIMFSESQSLKTPCFDIFLFLISPPTAMA
ncbi:hypothetical protein [Escherichia coli]|uniref:hypothetical protein n=1 Tax=Escherichia coli TaxID=562 RepID=UPI0012FDCA80|nr:hypothetical protein [Escherichia coli]QGY13550.1 hypothetical protein F6P95_17745 [Escherichia coli]